MHNKNNFEILNDSALNKSLAFSHEEREELKIRGLFPYATSSQKLQAQRVLNNLDRKNCNIERYIFLSQLEDRNERLYYKVIIDHIEQIMPLIYTPTVGQACKEFSHNFRQAKGFYINPNDKGHIRSMLDNWQEEDVRTIVITDGERILGLGDLGSNGMGISIGKLALYTACAGIDPRYCLPVTFDIGTNNQELLDDPLYLGYPHPRMDGEAYFELMDEFIQAVQDKFPKALIQFEDFLTPKAFSLLEKYQNKILCFNDDIQGTAAVALSGVYASTRISGVDFADLKIMFLGAGSAATGIADLMVSAFKAEGMSEEAAKKRLWFVNSKGLVVSSRDDLQSHNLAYAHDEEQLSLKDAINKIQPHILIGATGSPNTFTQEIIELLSSYQDHPTVFALSNPTSKAECTAEQAYKWSQGKVIFASGSPFAPVEYKDKNSDSVRTFRPGQGNNAYVFPGIGLGAIACEARIIPDELFLVAAKTLAEEVLPQDLDQGSLYPPLKNIRELSLAIATAVAEKSYELGIAQLEKPENLKEYIQSTMYDPTY